MTTIRKVDERQESLAEANANFLKVLGEAVVNIPKITDAVRKRKEAADPTRIAADARNDRLAQSSENDDAESKAMKSRLAKEKIGEQLKLLGEPQVTVPTSSEMPAQVDPAQVSKGGMATGLGGLIDNIVGGAGVQTETAHPKGQVSIEQGTGRQVTTTPGAVTRTPMNFRGLPYGTGAVLTNLLAKFFPGSGITSQAPTTRERETLADRNKRLAPAVASMASRMRDQGFNSRNVQDINLENAKRIGPTNSFYVFREAMNQVKGEQFELAQKKAAEVRAEGRLRGRPTTKIQDMRAKFAEKLAGGGTLSKSEQAASDFLTRTDPLQSMINQSVRDTETPTANPATQKDIDAFYEKHKADLPTDPAELNQALKKALLAEGFTF